MIEESKLVEELTGGNETKDDDEDYINISPKPTQILDITSNFTKEIQEYFPEIHLTAFIIKI